MNAPLLIEAPAYKDFVLEDLKTWRDEGLRTALLTLVKVEGRSPRPLGSQMAVAALLLILFVVRALTFERQRQAHEAMQIRAHDLELALTRATEAKTPSQLRLNSAGSVTIVNATDITLCKGADDYVELHLRDGRTVLHNGALAELESRLPPHFLRVHRSFIVNTAFVEKLTRDPAGTGFLTLSNGAQAPVSRRIMPKVREALG